MDGTKQHGRVGAGRRWVAAALMAGLASGSVAQAQEAEIATSRAEAGAYLAARAAGRASDFVAAAPFLERALEGDARNPFLLENALGADLGAGRFDAALVTAQAMEADGIPSTVGHMVLAAAHGRDGDWRGLLAGLEAGRGAGPLVDGLARGWARVGLGEREAALAAFDEVVATRGLRGVGLYHKALALGVLGDVEAAVEILSMEEVGQARGGVAAHARALGVLGRGAEGAALLDAAYGGDIDAGLAVLRDRLLADDATVTLPVVDARTGLAEVYHTIAGALDGEEPATALMYARVALAVDPANAEAALLAAAQLETLGQSDLAREAYGFVEESHPDFVLAELGRAAILGRAGEGEAAVEVLTGVVRDNPALATAEAMLGDELRRLDRLAEAEAAYGRAIALHDEDDGTLWFIHYARGRAREAAGDWAGAEADLRRAIALQPGQAQVLNHLGYGLVERGEKLEEALAMLEEAMTLEPRSGAIVDSLGWARFRLGQVDEAVGLLEQAAALEPGDPVVNDHLGDAYWSVGRTREAHVQWSRALSYDPAPTDAQRIRDKLARGLDAVLASEAAPEPAVEDASTEAEGGNGG